MIFFGPATSLTKAFLWQNTDKMCSPDLSHSFLPSNFCWAVHFSLIFYSCSIVGFQDLELTRTVCTEPSKGQGGHYYFRGEKLFFELILHFLTKLFYSPAIIFVFTWLHPFSQLATLNIRRYSMDALIEPHFELGRQICRHSVTPKWKAWLCN